MRQSWQQVSPEIQLFHDGADNAIENKAQDHRDEEQGVSILAVVLNNSIVEEPRWQPMKEVVKKVWIQFRRKKTEAKYHPDEEQRYRHHELPEWNLVGKENDTSKGVASVEFLPLNEKISKFDRNEDYGDCGKDNKRRGETHLIRGRGNQDQK